MTSAPGRTSWQAFSFGEHYDPARIGFGPLMVCNTDLVQTDHGYPDHPHRDAEIVSWVLEGSLRHSDSFGNTGIVYPGLAQRMSAGSGLIHAELNDAYRLDPDRPACPVSSSCGSVRTSRGRLRLCATRAGERGSGRATGAGRVRPAVRRGDRNRNSGRDALGHQARCRPVPRAASSSAMFLVVAGGKIELELAGRLGTGDAVELHECGGITATAVTDAELLILDLAR